jgi:5-methylcytosine-specific restriction endonuclease McrBC GTP-binding regulatory subunit McrB
MLRMNYYRNTADILEMLLSLCLTTPKQRLHLKHLKNIRFNRMLKAKINSILVCFGDLGHKV